MSHDAQRPEGGSAPLSPGPQMYSFDGRPVEPPVSAPRPARAPHRSPDSADSLDGPDRDAADRPPEATPDLHAMPSARWPLSVVGILFSLVFGAVALYFSYQVGVRWRRGDGAGAHKASQLAAVWSMVAIAIGVVGFLIMSSATV